MDSIMGNKQRTSGQDISAQGISSVSRRLICGTRLLKCLSSDAILLSRGIEQQRKNDTVS